MSKAELTPGSNASVADPEIRRILEYDRVLKIISGYAASQGGRAEVLSLLPSADAQAVEAEFDRLAEMLSIVMGDANFRPPETPVLYKQMARLAKPGVVLEGEEIVLFGRLFSAARSVRSYILRREDSLPCLSVLAGRLEEFDDLAGEIRRVFDENDEVRSNASPVLAGLRKDSRAVRSRIEKKLAEVVEHLVEEGSAGENFTTLRQERYVLAVRREEMHTCPGIIQGESGSGNTLFIEPEQVVHQNNRLREIELDIRREIYRILAGLSMQLVAGRASLETDIRVLALIDSLYARACYALEYRCHRPRLCLQGGLDINGARHPLLLARTGREEHHRLAVVPFSLRLEPGERTLLVSGPNAGGKTVLLKTVGLISLMAQSGIFPPVDEETSLPVFESVLTAIGDEQSIDMDLSTFSGHVRDLKTAIESGTPRSLALLDEIGVGTDPAEGAALASAVLEHLTSLGCLTLCTTHYGELKLLYERLTGLVNGSLEFDTESMKPTFVFRKGIPGQSYGLAIARNMGLEEPVLRRAEEYMKGGSADISRYIARLEEEQKKLTRELEAVKIKSGRLDHEARRLKEERGELRERAGELERREKDLERRMAEGERIMLLEARKEVEKVISKLEREYAGPEDAEKAKKQARRTLEDKITSLDAESRTQSATEVAQSQGRERENTYRAGDRVLIRGLDLEGEVVDGPDSSGRYFVLAGRARMTLEACELIPSRKKKPAGKRASYDLSGAGIASGDAAPPDKLDLRGMRPDEVAEALERFLGDAGVAGFHRVVVVHGKGTGALRAKVAELLSGDSRVENFRSGAWNEGGTGATIVSLQDAGEA